MKKNEAVSPVVAVIILVAITVVLAGVLYIWVSNTMQAGGLGKETTPTAIFLTKNAGEIMNEENHEQQVATITLTEGNLLNSEIQLMISADGDAFYEYTDKTQTPNNDPKTEWNPGESVIITEDKAKNAAASLVDKDADWASESFYVRIIYKPAQKMMFSSSVTLEKSTEIVDVLSASYEGDNLDHTANGGTGIQLYAYSTAIHHYSLNALTISWDIVGSPSGSRSMLTNPMYGYSLDTSGIAGVAGTNTQGKSREQGGNSVVVFYPDADPLFVGTYTVRFSVTYDGVTVSDTCVIQISVA
jgi:flagellin-like protein